MTAHLGTCANHRDRQAVMVATPRDGVVIELCRECGDKQFPIGNVPEHHTTAQVASTLLAALREASEKLEKASSALAGLEPVEWAVTQAHSRAVAAIALAESQLPETTA